MDGRPAQQQMGYSLNFEWRRSARCRSGSARTFRTSSPPAQQHKESNTIGLCSYSNPASARAEH